MNFNRIFLISFLVLMLSSYQSYSSILFTLMMKLLMIKGALFMSMPLGIGAFVMGQGMGFFAGNMMGGYMMLRAANRYHNKEKSRWVTHSGWHGPPYHSNNYAKGYQTGKGIVTAINLGQQKFKSIGNIIKAFVPSPPPKYGPPKYGPPPPVKYGPPDYSPFPPSTITYGSYSNPPPSVNPPPASSYGAPPEPSYGLPPPMSNYGPPPPNYGPPPPPSYGAPGDMYHSATGVPMSYHDYMPSAGRKNAFSNSLLNSVGGGGGSIDLHNKLEQEKNRRIHNEIAPIVSPSGFYTSAYGTPGQEFTGILTNEPTKQGDKYLRGEADHSKEDDMNTGSASSTKPTTVSSVTSPPNEILESYLEQRLKTEAEKQKDEERKQETQQLIQMLRKAYIKQLVNSIKEEEVAEKEKANRRLDTLASSTTSPFANLISSSIENLLGSRESRSIEQQNNNHHDPEANVRQRSMDLIRDFLINEVFTSDEQQQEQSTSNKVNPASLENIDTVEVESITERILSLTSTEREELVKGLDNLGQEQEETTLSKPIEGDNDDNSPLFTSSSSSSSSTENSLGTSTEADDGVKKRVVRVAKPANIDGAEWIPIDSHTYNSDQDLPFGVRLKRQTEPLTQSSPTADEQKQIQSFVEDIRKFFTLLSALDQDQCLQKLVCDVHTNEKDISTLTQYEINILTTFKLMKALMPEGEEDSSTKYRYAALLGETGQSMDLCQQQYTSCQVSSNQIVQLGSAEPQQSPQDTASNPLMMNLANLEQQSQAAAAMAGMNTGSPTTTSTTTSTTTTSTTTSTTVRPRRIRTRMTTTTPLPTMEMENTQRRNYVESNQYHIDQQRRRQQQQQYFHSQDQHNQQYQYGNHNQRPQQQFHAQRPAASASHSSENRASAEGGPGSNFFNYGEFSDFFRSMWSDTMMGNAAGGRGKRRRGQLKPQSQESYNHYWPGEVVEEIGI